MSDKNNLIENVLSFLWDNKHNIILGNIENNDSKKEDSLSPRGEPIEISPREEPEIKKKILILTM